MIYPDGTAPTGSVSPASPPASGAQVGVFPGVTDFRPWQPSTWPQPPKTFNEDFIENLRRIFRASMLEEINNVIEDAEKVNGDLQHRGHVVAIALMCALDALSSYGYRGRHIANFVQNHFPSDYQPYAGDIYRLYRNSLVHSWNLFEAAVLPGNEPVTKAKTGTLSFGLLNFFQALKAGVDHFLKCLETDANLQTKALNRYRKLRKTAK